MISCRVSKKEMQSVPNINAVSSCGCASMAWRHVIHRAKNVDDDIEIRPPSDISIEVSARVVMAWSELVFFCPVKGCDFPSVPSVNEVVAHLKTCHHKRPNFRCNFDAVERQKCFLRKHACRRHGTATACMCVGMTQFPWGPPNMIMFQTSSSLRLLAKVSW